jgi:hypothetical protein
MGPRSDNRGYAQWVHGPITVVAQTGRVLLLAKEYPDAEPLLLAGYEGMKERAGSALGAVAVGRGNVGLVECNRRQISRSLLPGRNGPWPGDRRTEEELSSRRSTGGLALWKKQDR